MQPTRAWNRQKRRAFIAAGLLIAAAYVIAAFGTDAPRLLEVLRELGLRGCAAVLSLSLANYLLRFQRWDYYLRKLGRTVPAGRHLLYYLSGFAFTVSPAKAGEAVRSLYLHDHGVAYSESMAALFVERLLDLLAITLLAALLVLGSSEYRPMLGAAAVLVAGVLAVASRPYLPAWVERLAQRLRGRAAALLRGFAALLRAARTLLHPAPLLFGTLIALAAWAAEGLGLYLICRGLHIGAGVIALIGVYAVAVLGGSIAFFLPAGIGGMEILMTTLLVQQGATLRVAIIATLLCRLATLWFAVIIGVAAATLVELTQPQRVRLA